MDALVHFFQNVYTYQTVAHKIVMLGFAGLAGIALHYATIGWIIRGKEKTDTTKARAMFFGLVCMGISVSIAAFSRFL